MEKLHIPHLVKFCDTILIWQNKKKWKNYVDPILTLSWLSPRSRLSPVGRRSAPVSGSARPVSLAQTPRRCRAKREPTRGVEPPLPAEPAGSRGATEPNDRQRRTNVSSPDIGPPSAHRMSAHRTSAHRTSAHRTSAHRTSAHRTSAHRTSARRTSAHRTSAHRTSAHRTSAHRTSAHRTSAHRTSAHRTSAHHTSKCWSLFTFSSIKMPANSSWHAL